IGGDRAVLALVGHPTSGSGQKETGSPSGGPGGLGPGGLRYEPRDVDGGGVDIGLGSAGRPASSRADPGPALPSRANRARPGVVSRAGQSLAEPRIRKVQPWGTVGQAPLEVPTGDHEAGRMGT